MREREAVRAAGGWREISAYVARSHSTSVASSDAVSSRSAPVRPPPIRQPYTGPRCAIWLA